MPMSDDENTRQLFEKLILIIAGEKAIDGLAAAQDLYCAMICVVSASQIDAVHFAKRSHDDVQSTIRKNFDWYKSQQNQQPDRKSVV